MKKIHNLYDSNFCLKIFIKIGAVQIEPYFIRLRPFCHSMIIKNRKEVGVTCGLGRASLAEIFGSGFGPFQKWEIHKLGPENCVGSFFYA